MVTVGVNVIVDLINLPFTLEVFIYLRVEGNRPSNKIHPTNSKANKENFIRMYNCYSDICFIITKNQKRKTHVLVKQLI